MGSMRPTILPLIPLSKDSVLFPGVTLRIPVSNRPDISNVLSSIFGRAARPRAEAGGISVGCVPLASDLISKDGQHLIDKDGTRRDLRFDVNPARAEGEDLFAYGTAAKIAGVQGRRPGELSLIVEGISRFKINRITHERLFLEAEVTHYDDEVHRDAEMHTLLDQLKNVSCEIIMLVRLASLSSRSMSDLPVLLSGRLELFIKQKDITEVGKLADFMANMSDASFEEKLHILATVDVKKRVQDVIEILTKQAQVIKGGVKVTTVTSTTFPSRIPVDINQINNQRQALTSRSMNRLPPAQFPIPGRMGDDDDESNEVDELKKKLDEAGLSPEAQKVAERELKRLKKMNPINAEYGVCRTYLEVLAEIPWSKMTEDQLGADTLRRARKQLDEDHYGLEKIKKRLLEYLAVLKLKQATNAELEEQISRLDKEAAPAEDTRDDSLKQDFERDNKMQEPKEQIDSNSAKIQLLKSKRLVDKSPILLLVGPPGTGKTSLAKSVATSLGRKFHRISLGGVRDESEIRGHRRTYVAAMPGVIVNGLRKMGVSNPVLLLDEIDKLGMSNFQGDPSAAMLEVLDPEQNHAFVDHYLNIPLDLSKVLFIATANSLDTIPPALLDRMETIQLSGYTTIEKLHIANRHLVPKQIATNGLTKENVHFNNDVVNKIITSYTREAGVRNLEREIGSVCRFKAVQYADAKDSGQLASYNPNIDVSALEEILGIERFDEEIAEKHSRPGVVTGLVAYSTGGQGSILFIEVADMPGNGRVQLTGKLGDVLKESVEVALTWVKAHSYELGLTADPNEDIMKNRSVHVHCPSGAIPKDGPSAGLAHTIALVSLFSGKAVPPQIAMTGEISLRGRVMPVGGIKEKLIGALGAGVKTVLLPIGNRKDAKELPQEVKNGLEIIHVKHIWEAMRHVWPDAHWPGEHLSGIESRL
ncbi:MAG: hypothetical protein M1834_004202 [Cirrosporium novae-zelandiae]|nr:MAG: hypothetical protein M1834_004202 [Cirrosporium novae-zelandiae]